MDKLWIITTYFNPLRSKAREKAYLSFIAGMARAGVCIGFELMPVGMDVPMIRMFDHHLELTSPDILYYKQNLFNIALKRLPSEAKYVSWMDCDIAFVRPDWAEATVAALKENDIVQMFSQVYDLNSNCEIDGDLLWSAAFRARHLRATPQQNEINPTDFAWAAKREVLDNIGGLVDVYPTIVGSDEFMAAAMLGGRTKLLNLYAKKYYELQGKVIKPWEDWAMKLQGAKVGYVDGLLLHYYHGKRDNRGYGTQWDLFQKHYHELDKLLYRDEVGLWRWCDPECEYAKEMRTWFESRKEDE
jgi:hypothetical protein